MGSILQVLVRVLKTSVEVSSIVNTKPSIKKRAEGTHPGFVVVEVGVKVFDLVNAEKVACAIHHRHRIQDDHVCIASLAPVVHECREEIKDPFKNGGVCSPLVLQEAHVFGSKRAFESGIAHLKAT
jgi:hypothetical protein